MVGPFVPQVSRGQPAELAIQERDEPLRRLSRGRSGSTRLCGIDDEKLPGPVPFQDKGITSPKNKLAWGVCSDPFPFETSHFRVETEFGPRFDTYRKKIEELTMIRHSVRDTLSLLLAMLMLAHLGPASF